MFDKNLKVYVNLSVSADTRIKYNNTIILSHNNFICDYFHVHYINLLLRLNE